MDMKITLSQAGRLMSERTGMPARVCEDFVKSLFAQISSGLEAGETVRIRDFGTFKITSVAARKSVDVTTGEENEIPRHQKVVFVPCKELASAVNAPFEMFDTIELTEDIIEDSLMTAVSEGDEMLAGQLEGEEIIERERAEEAEKAHEREIEERAAEALASVADEEPAEADESTDAVSSEDEAIEEPAESAETVEEPAESAETAEAHSESPVVEEEYPREEIVGREPYRETPRRGFGRGFLWGALVGFVVLALAGGVMLWFAKDYITPKHAATASIEHPVESEETAIGDNTADEIEEQVAEQGEAEVSEEPVAPTQPSDSKEPVYDTISHTRFLTTMAKDHYGNYHLWPYIYEENKAILGHPDRIRPGTKVVIPELSKYGVDPRNPEDISAAKRKGAAIYARYR